MTDRQSGSSEQPKRAVPASVEDPDAKDKIEHPQEHVDHPGEVVIDPLLSKDEKLQALDGMEQDAKQLSAAADEGMAGSDDGDELPDVLAAKAALEQPPFERALSVVLQSLRARLDSAPGTETRALVTRAIEALEAAGAGVASTQSKD